VSPRCLAVTSDEVAQALIALAFVRKAGIERIVHLSVIHADTSNLPHVTGKNTVESMIESLDIPTIILCPASCAFHAERSHGREDESGLRCVSDANRGRRRCNDPCA
jgi:uncharacterized protein YbjT (DUF2867 family)